MACKSFPAMNLSMGLLVLLDDVPSNAKTVIARVWDRCLATPQRMMAGHEMALTETAHYGLLHSATLIGAWATCAESAP